MVKHVYHLLWFSYMLKGFFLKHIVIYCSFVFFFNIFVCNMVFPGCASGKESACQSGRCRRLRFSQGSRKSPGRRNGNPLQFFAWKIHGQKSLAGYSLWGRKESDKTEQPIMSVILLRFLVQTRDAGSFLQTR